MRYMKASAIILMLWPYLGFVLFGIAGRLELPFLFWVHTALTVVVYVMCIVNACRCRGEGCAYQLAFWNMLIKLVHIPYYLFTLLVGILLLAVMVVPAFIFASPILVLVLSVINYLLLLTSSVYGINAVLRGRKEGTLPTKTAVCHGILHLLFVTDCISAVIVFVKLRKEKKKKSLLKIDNL